MKVALVQADLAWENIDDNLKYFEQKLSTIAQGTDLVVLPEMFSTGFTMHPENVAETPHGRTVQWMRTMAIQHQFALVASIVIKENEKYYNRLFFVFPDGNIQTYDKRHLFSLAGEHKKYSPGKERLIVSYKGWNICPLVCYDLRFPVFSRNTEDYDLLIYIASWPQRRINAWDILLKARAVENMVYTIGVNRVGTDQNQNKYPGHSQVIDYLGEYLVNPQGSEAVFYATLNKSSQNEIREKLGFLKDKDDFQI